MNLIAKLLPASNILLDADLTSKKRVFEQAGLLFENNEQIARGVVFDSLFAREKLGSTGLGQGVAIPHGRIKGLKKAAGAMIRVRNAVPFDAPDLRAAGARARNRRTPADPVGTGTDVLRQAVSRKTARRRDSG
jgi:mannitol/fructose-specific phosphotransferase system IIA component (Ntr-type)